MIIPNGLLINAGNLVKIARICWHNCPNKIVAIGLFRECTGLGLKPAKDMIDTMNPLGTGTDPIHMARIILNNYEI